MTLPLIVKHHYREAIMSNYPIKGFIERTQGTLPRLPPTRARHHLPRAGTSPAPPPEQGYLHCDPHGAGHFVEMVHNEIE
jgi:6-phosphogluconate dehydrogenase (decarboxylating)